MKPVGILGSSDWYCPLRLVLSNGKRNVINELSNLEKVIFILKKIVT